MKLAFSTNAYTRFSLVDALRGIKGAGFSGVEILADTPHAYPDHIDAALKLDPKSTSALSMRAKDSIDAGDFASAEADMAAIEKAQPDALALTGLRIALATKRCKKWFDILSVEPTR